MRSLFGGSRHRTSAFAALVVVALSLALSAGQSPTAGQGVYSEAQAKRGQAVYKEKCAACHGEALGGELGPPLSGDDFVRLWGTRPLSDLVNKIRDTMPANEPGTLTRQQSADLVAHILQVGKYPAGTAELAADEAALKQITMVAAAPAASVQPVSRPVTQQPSFPPSANLAQMMRGMLFPTSNLIFNVQTHDPGARAKGGYQPDAGGFSWVDWGADIYPPWELVDYAALAITEAAPLLLTAGRRCENGKPVPVDRPDWVKYVLEMAEAGRATYKAAQTRNQEVVSDATNQLADSCLNCHVAYRDKPGGTPNDPSNKAARCVP
jgi:mono/diheme cytochrome c family protein